MGFEFLIEFCQSFELKQLKFGVFFSDFKDLNEKFTNKNPEEI